MKKQLLALAGVAIAAVSIPAGIEACGDKFMIPGRGLLFEDVYKAKHPGAVLIYSPAGASRTDYAKLQNLLTRAGHKVTVVHQAHQVASTASAIKADVLVTALADAGTVGSQVQAGPSAPAILSVLATGNKAEKAACKQQPYVCEVKAQDSPEKFIVAVNGTMNDRTKARSKTAQPR